MIKTDAINLCLRYIGEAPLPSGINIGTLDPQHEAVIIDQIINEVSEKVQGDSWWFNRENWVFQPDSTTNKINIPSAVISLITTDGDYVVRGQVLYDRDNSTYYFSNPVSTNVVWNVKFEELPSKAAFYIAYLSAQEAQVFFNGDSFVNSDLKEKILKAYADLRKEELRQSGYNLVKGSRIVSRTTNPQGV